ncbi:hypothetical protein KSF_039980 [Reticulibacter mediterranei]|uniref:Uncharacterized protein n=1 Tax=Reticulibacter mediterranei TaxID=2778369 RepID=A0A8J3IK47_9CHLR|nr:hypothetical protein [Reticulibacter mediterranei]GHO93950.1 hypothetical protein KSF_039980 [Reticulibacter mediterranei]
MSHLLNLFKRTTLKPPVEVIQAACRMYGIAPEPVPPVQAEKLHALSDNIWVIKLNDQSSAVVAYTPGAKEMPVAAPWFD